MLFPTAVVAFLLNLCWPKQLKLRLCFSPPLIVYLGEVSKSPIGFFPILWARWSTGLVRVVSLVVIPEDLL